MNPPPKMLGPYPVERELGRGGMGVVYLARDPRLNRPVAIKVLSAAFAGHPEYLARFEREAKLLATLTHQNIASIHGVEETPAGDWLLVLEYVPGETLAERLARGPLPIEDALDCCRQIAVALEAAHEAGVIHRDLKPGNVKITPDGQVKVLDFGLAKGRSASPSDVDLALSPTYIDAPTAVGVILGTAGYMSPEQARGKAVDRRTDIWSFGCVLFECLTGALAFGGETTSDTIARILEREPDWAALPPQTPPKIRDLLRRCLEKDPRKRQRDIGDVRIELEEVAAARLWTAQPVGAAGAIAAGRPLRTLAVAAAMLAIGAAAGIASWTMFGPARSATAGNATGSRHLGVNIPPSVRATLVTTTPDGRRLLVRGFARNAEGVEERSPRLYTRGLHEEELKTLPGTEGIQGWTVSRDSRWIAFVAPIAENSSESRIVKAAVDGSSPPVSLADWEQSWDALVALESGDLLISATSPDGPVYHRLPAGGGPIGPPTKIDIGAVRAYVGLAAVLPRDRGVLVGVSSFGPRGYQNDVWVLDLNTNKATQLVENASHPKYAATGHLLFSRGDTLMAAPFDPVALKLTGELTALTRGLRVGGAWGHGDFDVSDDGVLTYVTGGRLGLARRLVEVEADGTVKPFAAEQRPYDADVAVSPDGLRVAVVVPNARGTYETWLAARNTPGLQRLTALTNADVAGPVWSPDGTAVAYNRIAFDKDDGVYVQRIDEAGAPTAVIKVDAPQVFLIPTSWKPDGTALIVTKATGEKASLIVVPVGRDGTGGSPRPLRPVPYDEPYGQFSPDGRLVAFISDQSGKYEVYVSTYEADGTLGPPLMISSGGGARLQWAADGRRLFYSDLSSAVSMVTINRTPSLSASPPLRAYDLRKLRIGNVHWDILADGSLVGIQKTEDEGPDAPRSFAIVLNWFDELKAKMTRR